MPISFDCPECGEALVLEDEMAGRRGVCTACQSVITAPEIDAYDLESGPGLAAPVRPKLVGLEPDDFSTDEPITGDSSRAHPTRQSPSILIVIGLVAATMTGGFLAVWATRATRPDGLKASPIAEAGASLVPFSLADRPSKATPPVLESPTPAPQPGGAPSPTPAPPRQPPSDGLLTTEEIVSRCEASVGIVRGPASSGTGFLVSPGLMATNAHVIRRVPAASIQVSFPSAGPEHRGPFSVQVVYFDDERDLAILALASRLDPLTVFGDHVFRRGQEVLFIGSPGLGGRMVLENVAGKGLLGSRVRLDDLDYYQLSGSVNGGNSGGPVIDMEGRVIGVVTARASKEEGLGFCIPAADLAGAVRTASARNPALQADAAQRHESASRLASVRVARSPGVARGEEEFAAEFLRTREPATWLASVDSNLILKDTSPRVNPFRLRLKKADTIYLEDDRTIALMLIQFVTKVRDAGLPFSCAMMLESSLTWAPPTYLRGTTPRSFQTFAEGYCELRINERLDHKATILRMQAMQAAPPVAHQGDPDPAPDRARPAAPPVPTPSTAKAPEAASAPAAAKAPARMPKAESPAGKFEAARQLEADGQTQGAIFAYELIIEKFPLTSQAYEAKKRLKKLRGE
jgi:S1-C subfamily serine protease